MFHGLDYINTKTLFNVHAINKFKTRVNVHAIYKYKTLFNIYAVYKVKNHLLMSTLSSSTKITFNVHTVYNYKNYKEQKETSNLVTKQFIPYAHRDPLTNVLPKPSNNP